MPKELCYCCGNKSSFVIVFDNGRDNEERSYEERRSCRNFRHMVDALICFPDRTYNRISGKDYPVLKNILRKAMILMTRGCEEDSEALERLCEEGQRVVNSLPIPGQLEFKFMEAA